MLATPSAGNPEDPQVLILGAGLSGLALLAELAHAGVPAVAIDPQGVGWGASGRGSRLVDLEWGRGPLPSASRGSRRWIDRGELVRAARHVVRPTPVALPLERGESVPRRRRARLAYGWSRLSAREGDWPSPLMLSEEERTLLLPGFRFGDEPATRAVYGAVVDDQRLTELRALEARRAGGVLLTRTELVSLESSGERGVARALLRDRLDGKLRELPCRAIVDATGAWSPGTLEALGAAPRDERPRAHLVAAALPHRIDAAARTWHPRDESPVRVVPATGGLVVSARGEPRPFSAAEPGPTDEERAHVAAFLADAFPGVELGRLLCWSTPLPGESASRPSPVSPRRRVAGIPLFSVAAPSLELHAHAARLARARLAHELSLELAGEASATGHLPGGDIASVPGSEATARAGGLDAVQARWMVLRYGSLVPTVLEQGDGSVALGARGIPLACEVDWLHLREDMRTLADLARSWRLPEIAASLSDERLVVDEALARLARLADWSPARRQREFERWQRERRQHYAAGEEWT